MHICFQEAVFVQEQSARRAIVRQRTFPAVSTLIYFSLYWGERNDSFFDCSQDLEPCFSGSKRFNGSGSRIPGEDGSKCSMRVLNYLGLLRKCPSH